jgi:hypothetical protein
MNETQITTHNVSEGRWAVEFTDLQVRNEHQRRVAQSFDRRSLSGILKLWLKVVTPGAQIIEQKRTDALTIQFPSRDGSRKFRSCFGGRPLSA